MHNPACLLFAQLLCKLLLQLFFKDAIFSLLGKQLLLNLFGLINGILLLKLADLYLCFSVVYFVKLLLLTCLACVVERSEFLIKLADSILVLALLLLNLFLKLSTL